MDNPSAGRYVSRAALKLAGAADQLGLDFEDKVVLDVGSSTGGFTDYALQRGAARVIAVEIGTDQLHPSLRVNPRVELHEKTDIRDFIPDEKPQIILIDVSFVSLRQILPAVSKLAGKNSQVVAMVKPQFEAKAKALNHGVIKNDSIRRQVLKDFEFWVKRYFVVLDKTDSRIAGMKGNLERFYLLQKPA